MWLGDVATVEICLVKSRWDCNTALQTIFTDTACVTAVQTRRPRFYHTNHRPAQPIGTRTSLRKIHFFRKRWFNIFYLYLYGPCWVVVPGHSTQLYQCIDSLAKVYVPFPRVHTALVAYDTKKLLQGYSQLVTCATLLFQLLLMPP
jgi:hypothetical protein